jgi:hypothetical protein
MGWFATPWPNGAQRVKVAKPPHEPWGWFATLRSAEWQWPSYSQFFLIFFCMIFLRIFQKKIALKNSCASHVSISVENYGLK